MATSPSENDSQLAEQQRLVEDAIYRISLFEGKFEREAAAMYTTAAELQVSNILRQHSFPEERILEISQVVRSSVLGEVRKARVEGEVDVELARIMRFLVHVTPLVCDAAYQATISTAKDHGPLHGKWLKVDFFGNTSYLHFPNEGGARQLEELPSFAPQEMPEVLVSNNQTLSLIRRLEQIRLDIEDSGDLTAYLPSIDAVLSAARSDPRADSEGLSEILQAYREAVSSMSPNFYLVFTGRLKEIWEKRLASFNRYEVFGATVAATMGLTMIWEGLTELESQLDAVNWFHLFRRINSSIGAAERGEATSTGALLHHTRDRLINDDDPSIQNLGRALLLRSGIGMNSLGDAYIREAKSADSLAMFYQKLYFSGQFFLGTMRSLGRAKIEGSGAEELSRIGRLAEEKFARVSASLQWALFDWYMPKWRDKLLSDDERDPSTIIVDIFDNQLLYPEYMRNELSQKLDMIRQRDASPDQ